MDFQNAEIITAMVTPFDEEGKLDFVRLQNLIEYLLKTGTQGILVSGTTGEGPTLSETEKLALIKKQLK